MMLDSRGLTLIEVLAAVAILIIATVSFIAVSDYTRHSFQQHDQKSEAIEIAENITNDLRDEIVRTKTLPVTEPVSPVPGYDVDIQFLPLDDIDMGDYDTSKFRDKQHISIQSIVFIEEINQAPQPRILTVTVYWE